MAFHPYPQVIRAVFNPHRFGPPRPVTAASPCSRVDRHGFGSAAGNDSALFRLAFALAPALRALTCCRRATPRVIMQKARRQETSSRSWSSLRPLVSARFQVLFHSPPGVLFTFPSRYWCTIGHSGVLSLGGWSPRIHAGFLVSHATRDTARGVTNERRPGCHRLWRAFPGHFGLVVHSHVAVPQPRRCMHHRFGLVPVRSPLLGESRLLSLPPGTEMFQFPGFARLSA